MPSGAKKRKVAKKKIRKEAHKSNHGTFNHSQENEPRSYDERDSDGEIEREEEDEKREFDGEDDTDPEEVVKEAISGEENVVDVLRQVQSEVDVDDAVNDTPHGDPSVENGIYGSEVTVQKEKAEVEELEELRGQDYTLPESMPDDAVGKPAEYLLPEAAIGTIRGASVEEVSDAIVERIPDVESVKQVVSLPEDVNLVTESAAVENLVISNVLEPELKVNGNEVLQLLEEKDKVSSITTDVQPEKIEEEVIPISADDSVKSSTIIGFLERENEDKVPKLEFSGASPVYINPLVDVKEEPFEQFKDQIGAVAVGTSRGGDDIEGLKANEHSEEWAVAAAVGENCSVDDVESARATEQQVVSPAVEPSPGVDDVKDLKTHEQSEVQMRAPAVDTSQGMEQVKELKAQETLEGQPLISSAPRAVQRTSWMSCCGLFEMFSGSHR
ncbi:hypothetical protein Ancab_034154 [Ancistrocladus abbreviatus]